MEYVLPQGYLSYSAKELWEKDRERFIRKYFKGEDTDFSSEALSYGTQVAETLDGSRETEDYAMEMLKTILPSHSIKDKAFTALFEGIPLLIKPDALEPEPLQIAEYKTGVTKWTQKKAEKHSQLHFYKLGAELFYGKKVKEIVLYWIPTTRENGRTEMTGELESFKVEVTDEAMEKLKSEIRQTAKEISDAYTEFINKLF